MTGQNLAVVAAGTVDLSQVASIVAGSFAAKDTAAGAAVMFKDTAGFTVGQVSADNGVSGAAGVVTVNADIDLVSTPGPLMLAQPVNAGTATVRFDTNGPAMQLTATGDAGVVTAQNLVVVGGGLLDLAEMPNNVSGNLAAVESTAGAAVRFLDASGFTVGSVAADVFAPGGTGIRTTGGSISLKSISGPVSLGQAVSTGTPNGGTILINSGAGISQTAGGLGAVTGQNLAVVAAGPVDLREIPNTVGGIFAAQDTAAGAAVMFKDAVGFTVGQVSADNGVSGATGVVTVNADIDLVSTPGPLMLAQPVNAGTATVRFDTNGPAMQLTATGDAGVVTAQNLVVVGGGLLDLAEMPNNVSGNLAAVESTAGAAVRFLDASGFTVGSVAADVSAPGAPGS